VAIQYAIQIASALDVLHQHGVLHRDLKPANVLFRDEQTAVLADFGLAKHLTRRQDEMALTRTGMVVGTLNYSSPEQISAQKVDHRSDQYSLGLVLYEMLVGMRAFIGKTPVEIAIKHTSEPAPRLPDKLAYLQPLMDRLLAKQAGERYETTADVVHALQEVAGRVKKTTV
jgi:serine/threonine-protein kinase PpkA